MQARPESFDKNLLAVQSYLRAFARQLCRKSRVESSELIQATNERILRKFHLFEEGTNFKGWAARVMVNVLRSKTREIYVNSKYFDVYDDVLENIPENFRFSKKDNPENILSWKQQWEKIIPHLNDPAWQYLWEYDGYKTEHGYEYISERFGVPVNTIKTRVFKFRKKIAKELAD